MMLELGSKSAVGARASVGDARCFRAAGGAWRLQVGACLSALTIVGCRGGAPVGDEGRAGGPEPSERQGTLSGPKKPEPLVVAPLPAAYCEIIVDGIGTLSTEDDYLPHVITCENGGAGLEALKAQAIAARSVAYYNMATSGSICDSQGCQVYSCGNEPNALAYQAVAETAGIYLAYNDTLTYGFYVAGDSNVMAPACVGVSGATEQYVTYNEGLTGTDVQQTTLGFIFDPEDFGYGQNRGCMSQWGARCLENSLGYDASAILRFFYGDDINQLVAAGPCVPDPSDDDAGDTTDDGDGDADGTTGNDGLGPDLPDPDDGMGDEAVADADLDADADADAADLDAGAEGPSSEVLDAAGCACAAAGPSPAPWALGLWALFGPVFSVVRRRRGARGAARA